MSEEKRKIVPLGKAEQLRKNLVNNFDNLSRLNCITIQSKNEIIVEIKLKTEERK